jgi:hypothetical protein
VLRFGLECECDNLTSRLKYAINRMVFSLVKVMNSLLKFFLVLVSVFLVFISAGLYKLILIGEEIKGIQKGLLYAAANSPEPKDDNIWQVALIVGFLALFASSVYHKIFEKLIDNVVNRITSLEWRFETISFRWYLILFWTHFPDKNKCSIEDILSSDYHRLLFEFYKISHSLNLYSGKSGGIGYRAQFKTDGTVKNEIYLRKMYEAAILILPNQLANLEKVLSLYSTHTYGEISIIPIFLIQMSFLACANRILGQEQRREFVEAAFDYFVRSTAPSDSDVTQKQIDLLFDAYSLISSDAKFIKDSWDNYRTDSQGTLSSLIIKQIPTS